MGNILTPLAFLLLSHPGGSDQDMPRGRHSIYFADESGFTVNYLDSAFGAGSHAQATAVTFILVYFQNVSQGHLEIPHQILLFFRFSFTSIFMILQLFWQ